MSGHSKWSTIKRKKAAVDVKRGKVFTKILKEVTVAARLGGADESGNPRLRAAVQDARANNVPSDNVDRAIKKGTGELEGSVYEEIVYEGYAPGGVAVMVEAMTDNRNRTVGEIRHVFTKYGGNLGQDGCVGYLFEKRGYFLIEAETMDEEAFMELALELEVDDLATDDGYELFTAPGDYLTVKQALAEHDVTVAVGQLAMLPSNFVEPPPDKVGSVVRLMEAMEDLDDVQNVWMNAQIDDSALEAEA